MLFIVGVALALVVGKLAGGRFERLSALGVRWWWAALIALALQVLVIYGPREPGLRCPDAKRRWISIGSSVR